MELNKLIDHTLLRADATTEEIVKLCQEARKYNFMSVCVNPFYVPVAKRLLLHTGIKVCTVVGFPLGATLPKVKAYEAQEAVKQGADEVDMVMNIAMAKERNFDYIEKEVSIVRSAIPAGIVLKVILETCYLTPREIAKASAACRDGGADFVKTSTGFGKAGAKTGDVRIMRAVVGNDCGVKASGGIHTRKEAMAMVAAGASRLGTSSSVAIMEGK